MKRWIKNAVPVVLTAAMLTGCSFGGNGNQGSGEQQTLKVMYYDEGSFFQEYGMLFSALYPEVDIQVVSTQVLYRGNDGSEEFDYEKALKEFIEREQPDIMMLGTDEYEKRANDGELYDLETLMSRDKYDTDGLVPGMLDHMKEIGGGQLYGLPSGFYSNVLYYNKAMFDKYNIPHPTDKMSWDEVINLAKLFPTDGEPEDRVYGLKVGYSGDLNEVANTLASSEGLNYVNATTKTMTINTAGWKNALETALSAINSDSLYFENRESMYGGGSMSFSHEDYLLRNPFISGRLAMTIDSTYLMQQIKEAKDYVKDQERVISDWDMVTVPVSQQYPDQSTSMWYNNIFAIAKDSPNVEAAWKFISYISSDEYARVKSKLTYNSGFSIRTKYIKDDEGRNFSAFYLLKPTRFNQYKDYDKLPTQFSMMFNELMFAEYKAIQDGEKSVEEALQVLELKGNELLAQDSMTQEELNEMYQKRWEEQMAEQGISTEQSMLEQAAGISRPAEDAVDTEEEAAEAE